MEQCEVGKCVPVETATGVYCANCGRWLPIKDYYVPKAKGHIAGCDCVFCSTKIQDQPAPVHQEGSVAVTPILMDRLMRRREFGLGKYGVELCTFDGRRSLEDAVDEGLDLLVYLIKELEERKKLYEELHQLRGIVNSIIPIVNNGNKSAVKRCDEIWLVLRIAGKI